MSLDALYEAITLDRRLEPSRRSPYGGWTHIVKTYSKDGNVEPIYLYDWWWSVNRRSTKHDIAYYNQEGKKHRLTGPAYIGVEYGYELWFKDNVLHCEDGPAIRQKKTKIYVYNGKLHRLDGPAIESPDHRKEYWIDGVYYPPKQYKWEINRRNKSNAKITT